MGGNSIQKSTSLTILVTMTTNAASNIVTTLETDNVLLDAAALCKIGHGETTNRKGATMRWFIVFRVRMGEGSPVPWRTATAVVLASQATLAERARKQKHATLCPTYPMPNTVSPRTATNTPAQ